VKIDITFDFRKDSKGKDPDSWSPTLKSYQQSVLDYYPSRITIEDNQEISEYNVFLNEDVA